MFNIFKKIFKKRVNKQKSKLPSHWTLLVLFVSVALLTHFLVDIYRNSDEDSYVAYKLKPIFSRFSVGSVIAADEPVQILSEDPAVRLYPNLISAKESKELIALAKNRLQESKVMHGSVPAVDYKIRSSKTAYLERSDSRLVGEIGERVCKIVACDVNQIEPLQVVHYSKGQLYRPHHDFFEPGAFDPKVGQRLHTFLIYLNDLGPDDGGLTFFPQLNIRVQPKRGTALYFRDLDREGNPDPRTLHAGEAVLNPKIEKWAINVWIREKTYSDMP